MTDFTPEPIIGPAPRQPAVKSCYVCGVRLLDARRKICKPCAAAEMHERRLLGKDKYDAGGPLSMAVAAAPIMPATVVQPLAAAPRKTDNREIIARLEDIGIRILDSITDDVIAEAKLKDRMIAAGIVLDKRQLLSGLPTQILSLDERKSLKELVPMLFKEATRRGIVLDGSAVDVTLPQRTEA